MAQEVKSLLQSLTLEQIILIPVITTAKDFIDTLIGSDEFGELEAFDVKFICLLFNQGLGKHYLLTRLS